MDLAKLANSRAPSKRNHLVRSDLIAQARAVPIEDEIAGRRITLNGRGAERFGPCPKCGGTDRFAINISKQIWNCRGCQRGGDVISLVQHLDECTFDAAVSALNRQQPTGYALVDKAIPALPDAGSKAPWRSSWNREALAIWAAACEPEGTPAWTYLLRRGIALEALPSRINEALRFHPNCPWHDARHMCLVALWTDNISGEPRAIHRRAITPDGKNWALASVGGDGRVRDPAMAG